MPIVLSDRPAGPWAQTLESFLAMLMDTPRESAAAAIESAAAAENDDDDSAQAAPGSASAAPGAVADGAQSWLDAMDD